MFHERQPAGRDRQPVTYAARNPFVRRRWRLVTALVVTAAVAWNLSAGILLRGVELSPRTVARLPYSSPTLFALVLALAVAIPTSIAAFRTIASAPDAMIATVVAGDMLVVWAVLQPVVCHLPFWPTLPVALAGLAIAAYAAREHAKERALDQPTAPSGWHKVLGHRDLSLYRPLHSCGGIDMHHLPSGEMMNLLPTHRPAHSLLPDISEFFANFPPMNGRPLLESHLIRVEDQIEDHKYTVRAEIPGIDPSKDLDITVRDGVLTIKAERTERKEGETRSEFSYGSFVRSMTLPSSADEAAITADYDKGILTVTVPVGEATMPERHIQIGSDAGAAETQAADATPAAAGTSTDG